MLRLSQYENKPVSIVTSDGEKIVGKVTLFTPAKDNDENEDAIVVNNSVWLDAHEIKTIEITGVNRP